MPSNRVVGQRPQHREIVKPSRELEGADANVARRHTREHGPLLLVAARDHLARRNHSEAPRRGNAERVHRLADDVLAQHRPERRAAVAASRVARLARTLELDVDARTAWRDLLAEHDRAPVAEHGEVPVLVPCVGLRDRRRACRHRLPAEDRGEFADTRTREIEPEFPRERLVRDHERRRGKAGGLAWVEEHGGEPRVRVVEVPVQFDRHRGREHNRAAAEPSNGARRAPTPTKREAETAARGGHPSSVQLPPGGLSVRGRVRTVDPRRSPASFPEAPWSSHV